MSSPPFSPTELIQVGHYPTGRPNEPVSPIMNSPISARENLLAFLSDGDPLWMPHQVERLMFNPSILPDNIARGFITESMPFDFREFGGKDMFGVEWEFDPAARGSMVRQGNPLVTDLSSWEEQVVFPNPDDWDWEGSAAANRELLSGGLTIVSTIFTGLVERLISFVDMENALVALVDEDDQEAVHRLFNRLCEFYDDLFGRLKHWYHCDVVWFHDDWGSQRGPLFSPETGRKMVLPYLKRIVASAHRNGLYFELHSCGKIEPMVPLMIEAGVDMWAGQEINDKEVLANTYPHGIRFGIDPRPLSPDADEDTVRSEIRRLLDTYPNRNVFVGLHRGLHPLEYQILYEESRKRYCQVI